MSNHKAIVIGNLKRCSKCLQWKSFVDFGKKKKGKLLAQCRTCNGKRIQKWKETNKERIYNQNKLLRETSKITAEGRASILMRSINARCKMFNLECNITPQFLTIVLFAGKCQKSGIPFDFSSPRNGCKNNPFAPSVDRINPTIGYLYGNVQVVCNLFNFGKNDADELDFIAMCLAVAECNSSNLNVIHRLTELRNARF